MGFWLLLGQFLFVMALGALLSPKQKTEAPKPSSLGDFTAPTAEEGRVLPVIMGTCKISAPNVTWYGDLRVDPIQKRVKTGACSHEDITTGYKYYLGMQLSISMGQIDHLLEIWAGDKKAWSGNLSPNDSGYGSIYINNPDLFGGNEKEGGLQGTLNFYFGSPNQGVNDYLQSRIGQAIPAYRNVCHCVYRQGYMGTTPYIKDWAFVLSRFPKALGSGYYDINGDANPIEMIFEILTNNLWGLGMSSNMIDIDNFRIIAQKIKDEGLGLSMCFDTQSSARDLIQEIERHIDGTMFTDPETGKFKIILVRDDYDIDHLLEFNPSNVVSVNICRDSWPETFNEIKVSYIDRAAGFKEKFAQAQDIANLYIQGGEIVSETMDFRGFSNSRTAQLGANRALRMMCYPLDKITVKANRIGYQVYPGSVFKLNWPPLGIENKVYRVARPQYGTLENGEVSIEAVQDFYGLGETTFTPPQPSDWIDPTNIPLSKIIYQSVQEANFFWQGVTRWIAVGAIRPNYLCVGYDVYTQLPGDIYRLTNQISTFTPGGLLVADYPRNTNSVDGEGFYCLEISDMNLLQSITDADLYVGKNLLVIDGEMMAWKSITFDEEQGQYKISGIVRGVLDTIPADHKSGAIVGFISAGVGLTAISPYNTDLTVNIKLAPRTAKEVFDYPQADTISITTQSRAWKPYPPGNFCLNGKMWPGLFITGPACLTWAHRTRQQGNIVAQNVGNTVSTPEGSYTINLYINNSLKKTLKEEAGTSFTYTVTDRIADGGIGPVKLEIVGVNGSYSSTPRSHEFIMAGYGMAYGQSYGGC